jgi:uncharacterized protein YecT (DUF1311 family)
MTDFRFMDFLIVRLRSQSSPRRSKAHYVRAWSYLPLLLVCYVNAELVFAQTSPKGTFKIESVTKQGQPDSEDTTSDYVVSTTDPNMRELLHDHPDTTGADYYISPDEKWIYGEARYGHRMTSGELYKRAEGLKFQEVNKAQSFAEQAWRFFVKEERLKPDDVPYLRLVEGHPSEEGIIDFVAWSPDSARLLVDLRAGDFGGKRDRGIYKWYLYFNADTQAFELTDYLRRLNKGAWIRWKNFGEEKASNFPEAASAEPLVELPSDADLKQRYEEADRRLNDTYQQIRGKIDKQEQDNLRQDEREWLKTREPSAKFYADSGPKSTAQRRYWQYMLDSTQARLRHLETYWKPKLDSEHAEE